MSNALRPILPSWLHGSLFQHDQFVQDKSWLTLADKDMLRTSTGKKMLFDAGGSYYDSGLGGASTKWFVDEYAKRGIDFDKIVIWEAQKMDDKAYWAAVPDAVKPKITLYNGVYGVTDPKSSNNPVSRLASECKEDDFCVLKIDVDTPPVEDAWLKQLLEGDEAKKVDEYFFEQHVHGRMQPYGWGDAVQGQYADTYDALQKLRERGVRAHSWV